MKFLLTEELGRLAKWLRILGFDTKYFKGSNAGSLIIEALRDERIILSRNHRLPKTSGTRIVMIESQTFKKQASEVLTKLNIKPDAKAMFSLCTICNQELIKIEKEKVKERVPEYVFQTQTDFVICPECRRIYWQGTHWGKVEDALKEIIK